MALQILSSTDGEAIAAQMSEAIQSEIPGCTVKVTPTAPGHFEVSVTHESFEGQSRVKRQQRVYAAIASFMQGDAAPVHAIDRMETAVS